MPVERKGGLQFIERLLKQGKVQDALGELQRSTDPSAQDPFTLNRLGDLLARQGRRAEAMDYYKRIGDEFAEGGFAPKAIAIYKKILRLDPQDLETTVRLGELYFRENLRGEGRDHLLHAANQCVQRKDWARARQIFERLAAADPKDLRHRTRLAEVRAAAGDKQEAGEELLAVARALLDTDRASEAQPLYEQAARLLPDSNLPTLGLARCLNRQGLQTQALAHLERAVSEPTKAAPAVLAELALAYEAAGRGEEALGLLGGAAVLEIPHSVWRSLFAGFLARGQVDHIWARLGPRLDGDMESAGLVALLETLSAIESGGHVPALERLLAVHKRRRDNDGVTRALELLVRAYDSRSMVEDAARARAELAGRKPQPAEAPGPSAVGRGVSPAAAAPTTQAPARRGVAGKLSVPAEDLAPEVEAPAVPLNRADEEFVAGRLTQAEVLEKYGLKAQALEQLDEVATRYPGHVGAQESRVILLRGLDRPQALCEALAALAIARRAEGDATGARAAADEAAQGPLEAATRAKLRQLGWLGAVASAAPLAHAAPAPATVDARRSGEVDLDLDFDEPAAAAPAARPPAPARAAETAAPPDPRDEIAIDLPAHGAEASTEDAAFGLDAGDADLRAIAEALESELGTEAQPLSGDDDSEPAFEEVFASFKERVAEEVSADDYRTHYDLGIGYKEMGLVDEAIDEFAVAAASAAFQREACTMIAMCHRERGRVAEAADWYRKALAAVDGHAEAACELRYDLAEALLEAGDTRGALDEFRGLAKLDPSFRDVGGRISEIEAHLVG